MRAKHPITNITALSYPHLGWIYDPVTGQGPLHIAEKRCKQNGNFRALTNCGRAIQFQHYFGNGITKAIPQLEGWRLCGRCGSEAVFAEALARFKTGHAKSFEEYKARRAEEDRQRDIETAEREARVERLKLILNVGRFVEDRSHLIAFAHEGYKYTISEEGVLAK